MGTVSFLTPLAKPCNRRVFSSSATSTASVPRRQKPRLIRCSTDAGAEERGGGTSSLISDDDVQKASSPAIANADHHGRLENATGTPCDQRNSLLLPAMVPTASASSSSFTTTHFLMPTSILCHGSFFIRRPNLLSTVRCSSKKQETGFTDRILDYIEGGPKLRKWYGAPDLLPADGGSYDAEDDLTPSEEEETRDAVFVTNGDSEIGQMVILSLILKRARVKALVKDKRAAFDAFGTYVEPVSGDLKVKDFLAKALRGVCATICPANEGFLSDIQQMKGIKHIVLLSQLAAYKGRSGLRALLNRKLQNLAERDKEAVIASGIPYTIIMAGILQDSPGGTQGFSFKEGVASEGQLSKEDAARICVEALDVVPRRGIVLEVASGEEKVSDWKEVFASRIKEEEQFQ